MAVLDSFGMSVVEVALALAFVSVAGVGGAVGSAEGTSLPSAPLHSYQDQLGQERPVEASTVAAVVVVVVVAVAVALLQVALVGRVCS